MIWKGLVMNVQALNNTASGPVLRPEDLFMLRSLTTFLMPRARNNIMKIVTDTLLSSGSIWLLFGKNEFLASNLVKRFVLPTDQKLLRFLKRGRALERKRCSYRTSSQDSDPFRSRLFGHNCNWVNFCKLAVKSEEETFRDYHNNNIKVLWNIHIYLSNQAAVIFSADLAVQCGPC